MFLCFESLCLSEACFFVFYLIKKSRNVNTVIPYLYWHVHKALTGQEL